MVNTYFFTSLSTAHLTTEMGPYLTLEQAMGIAIRTPQILEGYALPAKEYVVKVQELVLNSGKWSLVSTVYKETATISGVEVSGQNVEINMEKGGVIVH